MNKKPPTNRIDLNINDRQLLEQIGQQVLHLSRRKIILSENRKKAARLVK